MLLSAENFEDFAVEEELISDMEILGVAGDFESSISGGPEIALESVSFEMRLYGELEFLAKRDRQGLLGATDESSNFNRKRGLSMYESEAFAVASDVSCTSSIWFAAALIV